MGTYRIDQSYDWNYEHGPSFTGSLGPVPETPEKDFFGYPVRSRIGIAAGLLLNSQWIEFYARAGFDLLTYKTVRKAYRPCYEPPNWAFVERETPLDGAARGEAQVAGPDRPEEVAQTTSTVSFGMPSKDPETWMADAARAREAIGPGQVLIVSSVATPAKGAAAEAMIEEFGELAGMAKAAGAQVVEANLSCPNVTTAEGDIFMDAALSGRIAAAMRQAVGDTPVLLKVGYIPERAPLDALLRAVDGRANGVILVNGVSRPVQDRQGQPYFGAGRENAGILGTGVRDACLGSVRDAVETIGRDRLDLRVIGVGGIMAVEDAQAYFDAGAYAVMMGGAPMYDPGLAIRFKAAHPEW